MLPMQENPNMAPAGLMFRTGGEVGVIVDHNTAYKVYQQKRKLLRPHVWVPEG